MAIDLPVLDVVGIYENDAIDRIDMRYVIHKVPLAKINRDLSSKQQNPSSMTFNQLNSSTIKNYNNKQQNNVLYMGTNFTEEFKNVSRWPTREDQVRPHQLPSKIKQNTQLNLTNRIFVIDEMVRFILFNPVYLSLT